MDPMITLVIALVAVALLGPAAGYWFAARRFKGSGQGQRVRELEDEIRGLRAGPAWATQQRMVPAAPPVPAPPPPGGFQGQGSPFQTPQHQGSHPAPAPTQRPSAHRGDGARPHLTAQQRFDQEPPLFGDAPSASPQQAPPPRPVPHGMPAPTNVLPAPHMQPPAPVPAPQPPQETAKGDGSANPTPAPAPAPAEIDQPAPHDEASKEERPAAPASFTPVSDLIDEAVAKELDWLGTVSAGRRVRLKKLGYDAPEKMANLRRSEVRRLARELAVTEDVIQEEWMPAAAEHLKRKNS